MNDTIGIPTKRAPIAGIIIGAIGGAIGAAGLLVIGGILSFFGIWLIGVPLMFAAGAALIGGPIWGYSYIQGPCPYCQSIVLGSGWSNAITCQACKKQVIVKDKQFYRVE